jgi:hypothetical protein
MNILASGARVCALHFSLACAREHNGGVLKLTLLKFAYTRLNRTTTRAKKE